MRARDLGIFFEGITGTYNAITDVQGVEVGFKTLIYGDSTVDTSPADSFARTGVTAILPKGKNRSAVFAGRHDLNGNGELTGTHWIDDSGFLHGPILLTNTNSVGIVRDSASKWMIKNKFFYPSYRDGKEIDGLGYFYPTVGETFDGVLNNINGFKVTEENVIEALESAKGGNVLEGNVGGGTGMRCHGFKGGTGTSSRIINILGKEYTVGVLVQANHGTRDSFTVNGIPVGKLIQGYKQQINTLAPKDGTGSIIVVVATDAPLMPWQLSKLCKRVPIGIGNLGGGFENGSGDIFIAFSTANDDAFSYTISDIKMLSDEQLDPIYAATSQATCEAILNAMVAAESMYGRNRNFVPSIPLDQLEKIINKYQFIYNERG